MRLRSSAMLRDLLLRSPAAAAGAALRRVQPLATLCRRPRAGGRAAVVPATAARLHPWWGGGGRPAGPLAVGLSSSPSEILQELGKGGSSPAPPQQQQLQQQQQPPPPGASPSTTPPGSNPKDGSGETDGFGNSEGKEPAAAGEK